MNISELKPILDDANISEGAYSFTSDGFGEVYRIAPLHDMLGDGWEVYYFERGHKNNLVVFRSESEACEHFLHWILRDSTAQNSKKTKPAPFN